MLLLLLLLLLLVMKSTGRYALTVWLLYLLAVLLCKYTVYAAHLTAFLHSSVCFTSSLSLSAQSLRCHPVQRHACPHWTSTCNNVPIYSTVPLRSDSLTSRLSVCFLNSIVVRTPSLFHTECSLLLLPSISVCLRWLVSLPVFAASTDLLPP